MVAVQDLSLYGLVLRMQDEDSVDRDEVRKAFQEELDGIDECTSIEKTKVKEFLQAQKKAAEKESYGAKKVEKLQELITRVDKVTIQKEPREIRRLLLKVKAEKETLEKEEALLEKWRKGKHKFKSVQEANDLVSKAREREKALKKDGEKLEKLRITRTHFGAADSDDNLKPSAQAQGWAKIANPAVSTKASAKKKNAAPTWSSGPSKWEATDMTLAQQLQMKMVADLRTAEPAAGQTDGQAQQSAANDADNDGTEDESRGHRQLPVQTKKNAKAAAEKAAEDDGFQAVNNKKKAISKAPVVQQQHQQQADDSDSEDDNATAGGSTACRSAKQEGGVGDEGNRQNQSSGAAQGSKKKKKKTTTNLETQKAQEKEDWALPKQPKAKAKKAGPSLLASTLDFVKTLFSTSLLRNFPTKYEDAKVRLLTNPLGVGPVTSSNQSAWKTWAYSLRLDIPFAIQDTKRAQKRGESVLQITDEIGPRMVRNWKQYYPLLLNILLLLYCVRAIALSSGWGETALAYVTIAQQLHVWCIDGLAEFLTAREESLRENPVFGVLKNMVEDEVRMIVLKITQPSIWIFFLYSVIRASVWWHIIIVSGLFSYCICVTTPALRDVSNRKEE